MTKFIFYLLIQKIKKIFIISCQVQNDGIYRMMVYNEKRLKKTETEEKEDQGSVRV